MSGAAGLAVFGLLALVAANAWSTDKSAFTNLAAGQINTSQWKTIGLELLGVVVAAFIAGASDGAAKIVLVLTAGLWILFAINTFGGSKKPATSPSSATSAAKGTVV